MAEVAFTAGITLHDGQMLSVDATSLDGSGIGYTGEDGPRTVPWSEVKAVMLATTDHMLESGGSLFSMAELLQQADPGRVADADGMRRFGARLLQQAAPRLCPLGAGCGLRPSP
ncbi:MAG: hypothetical protein KY439_03215 [Actinobacteria bacterium]|nr:hypothetical protein [Actinomycetota bacterium]